MSTRLILAIISTLIWETLLVIIFLYILPIYDIHIAPWLVVLFSVLLGIYAVTSYIAGSGAFRKQPLRGLSSMEGCTGYAVTSLNTRGTVKIDGEFWNAVSAEGKISAGEKIIVLKQDGLTLTVGKKHD